MKTIEVLASLGELTISPIARATRLLSFHASSMGLALALPLALAACSAGELGAAGDVSSTGQGIQDGDPGSAVPGIVHVYAPTSERRGGCSGVMLTNTWLLTARHCVRDEAGNVAAAETVLVQSDEDSQDGVANVIVNDVRDVALINLERPWSINGSTDGFLRDLSPNKPNDMWRSLLPVYCAGWGQGTSTGGGSGKLRNFTTWMAWAAPDESTFWVSKNLRNQVLRRGDSGGGCFDPLGTLLGITSETDDENNSTMGVIVSVYIVRDWINSYVPGY